MFENLPFWHAFFTHLGFEVVLSDLSTRNTYIKGQFSIPSDTVCYPAKLVHGHIVNLLERLPSGRSHRLPLMNFFPRPNELTVRLQWLPQRPQTVDLEVCTR